MGAAKGLLFVAFGFVALSPRLPRLNRYNSTECKATIEAKAKMT